MLPGESPEKHVVAAALAKARDVARAHPGAVVIGADTVVVADDKVLGKPVDEEDARAMLSLLNGRSHHVYTGLAVVVSDGRTGEASGYERTEVRFRPMSQELIARYIATGEPMDKAGAYAIQGYGSALITGITGDYFNVVGLPIHRLGLLLEELRIEPAVTWYDI